jgi:RNA polymerase-binding transcription factor DksA
MPSKKSAARKSAPGKKATSKKVARKATAGKSSTGKKTPAKGARKTAQKGGNSTQASARKGASRPRASDFVKKPSHTPAIFKTSNRRGPHILFTIEDVRELLQKRSREEREENRKKAPVATAKKAPAPETVVEENSQAVAKSKHQAASLEDILGLSPSPSGTHASREGKVPRKFQKYYKLLIELRDQVRSELNLHSNDTLKRSQKDDAGDIAISVDAGTDNFDRDFALSLLSSEQDALKEIEAAIERIHKGVYGICEVTGEAIKAERLEAVPFTRFSVEGQKQYESSARKRVSRTGAFLNESSGEKISFGDDDGDN